MRAPMLRLLFCVSLAVPAAAATLEGVVVEHLSRRPVKGARVSVQPAPGGAAQNVSIQTDSAGRFAFAVPAGAYLLSAERPHYAAARYGQKRRDGPGTPVVLEDNSRFFAEIRLKRLAAISGQVRDENQVGLATFPVLAFRAGKLPLQTAGAALSDDRGVYRIAGLPPGRYYVRTGPWQFDPARSLLPTYYGQSTSVAGARLVEVDLDEEAEGVTIEPLPGRLGRLEGVVTGAPSASVQLFGEAGSHSATVGAGQPFVFDQLDPGLYHIYAQALSGQPLAAYRPVLVGEGSQSVVLQVAPPSAVRVRYQDQTGTTVDPAGFAVRFQRKQPSDPAAQADVKGAASALLPPGKWQITVTAPGGYYVEAIQSPTGEEQLVLDAGLAAELLVLVGARPATLAGITVTPDGRPAPGAAVFLRSDPSPRSAPRRIPPVRTGDKGEYRFTGLPPGRYQVLASFDIEEPEERDWAAATSLTLGEGAQETLELKVVALP